MAQSGKAETSPQRSRVWKIQTATWRDYSQLVKLEKICFRSEDIWPFWDLFGVLSLPGIVRLKAVVDDQMVGFISGERDHRHRWGWVTSIGVLPPYRKQGIAQALLTRCENLLNLPVIRLSVRASNQAAVQLYLKMGYQKVARWKRYYNGGEDGLVFEKTLT